MLKKEKELSRQFSRRKKIKKTQSSGGYFFRLPPIIYIADCSPICNTNLLSGLHSSNKTVIYMYISVYLKLKPSSESWNRLNVGSICGTREAEGALEELLYCCRRDHKSLYSLSSFGYSPSNACFKNVDAASRKEIIKQQQIALEMPIVSSVESK